MSWLQRLSETYGACFAREQFAADPLTPIDHAEQQAHLEIVLDEQGNFLRAYIVAKENTLLPATEQSAGRTSGPAAHPLCDKLRYVAADFGAVREHTLYRDQLQAWALHADSAKLRAVFRYIERGTAVRDLLSAGILVGEPGSLKTVWGDALSPLARLLTADPKTKERDQGDALIRWRVEIPGEMESAVWRDPGLQREWATYNATLPAIRGLCLNSGAEEPLATSHPKRLRHGGDGAKLISSNDANGFTFRGRFSNAGEVYGLGSAATQKAHNALRWLIRRQSARQGDQVIVSWAVQGQQSPPLVVDSAQFFLEEESSEPFKSVLDPTAAYQGDAGQAFALRLKKAVRGYRARLGESSDIVVLALDSATPGRMAILYYRELKGSEFLDRIERWHAKMAWPQNLGKEGQFIGAPAPRDIAEAAYGRRVDDKLRKAIVERLLPCIVDGRPLPHDLELAATRRAVNRTGLEHWEFERTLGVACSLIRAAHPEKDYKMNLEETRTSRDYLYGRLLAIAESIEEMALSVAKENRETNAARLMQRFADHPFATWRTIELQLRPYIARLRSSRYAGALVIRQRLLDTLVSSFPVQPSGESSFSSNQRLSGEFLLGYHSQREALRNAKNHSFRPDADLQEESQGENE